ncbi:MAG: SocA family protein [Chloroflexi bacterium]|nr:SocA family protein [Chloroflexota bacterium]
MIENPIQALIVRILVGFRRPIYRTKLVKLAYLIDYTHYRNFGRTLSGLSYEWDNFGPNAVGNAIVREADDLIDADVVTKIVREADDLIDADVVTKKDTTNPYGEPSYLYGLRNREDLPEFEPQQEYVIDQILKQYGRYPPNRLATLSKRTKPFVNARKYTVLKMEQDTPAVEAEPGEIEGYEAEKAKHGTKSLAEVRAELGLA